MWHSFLQSRYAPLLTHASLLLLTASLFAVLLRFPFWIAFVPCAIVQHRIGVLLHEYIHGIPFEPVDPLVGVRRLTGRAATVAGADDLQHIYSCVAAGRHRASQLSG